LLVVPSGHEIGRNAGYRSPRQSSRGRAVGLGACASSGAGTGRAATDLPAFVAEAAM
jgi:hypothetical protein